MSSTTPPQTSMPRASVGADVTELLLPSLRRRGREMLLFLALFQSIYVGVVLFSSGEAWTLRVVLNVLRLLILSGCVHALGTEGSRSRTLAISGLGLGTQLLVGTMISIARHDVIPTALLFAALNCISAALIPWGFLPQLVLAGASAACLAVAVSVIGQPGATAFGTDAAATAFTTLAFTTWIAHFLDRSRRLLEQRLEEARRADAELAALRGQLEQRVAERTAELEMANRELEGFSYTVSHDLRSPLRTISGFAQMILDESAAGLDDAATENLSKIRAASGRMDELIDDMLLLARVGRVSLRYETVDVAMMASKIAAQLATEQPGRHVELSVAEIPPVQADHGLLQIAMDNLLRNAWKFSGTASNARVTISGERIGSDVVIRVEDNGVGFDPRFRHKLFLPFQRLHDPEAFPGTGVGLATVARIARRHGGVVDAASDGETGAVFTMKLPAARPA